MTREEIIREINQLLIEEFEIVNRNFTGTDNLTKVMMLDSINLVDLVAIVQTTYGITIPLADLKQIVTFNDLYDYIEQHQA
jgi:acyl carrier protein